MGLMAIDDETLAYLESRPALVRRLGEDAGGAFAAFGRSIKIRGTAVDVPGGAEAASLWQSLVKRPPTDADRFVSDLFRIDGGRLAYFYDTVAHLTPERRDFALGLHVQPEGRADFVKRVYRWFADVEPAWSVMAMPFRRPAVDPFIVLSSVDIQSDGTVGPSWWPASFDRVLASGDWPAAGRSAARPVATRPADAPWLLEFVFSKAAEADARLGTLRYAQRQLARVTESMSEVFEIGLRTRAEMPALALSLERMGVRDPALVRTVARAAHQLTLSGDFNDVARLLTRWQATLALLEQIQVRAPLPQQVLSGLLESLSAVVPSKQEQWPGLVASWVAERLLPALALPPPDRQTDFERLALQAFARDTSVQPTRFSWEGLSYNNDPSTLVVRSALAIRRSRLSPLLQDLVALQQAARWLDRGVKTLDEVSALADALSRIEPAMQKLPKLVGLKLPPIVEDFHASIVSLRRITKPGDIKKVADQRRVILAALDSITDATVPSLVYALASSPTTAPAPLGDAWFFHSLRDSSDSGRPERPWRTTAWLIPTGDVASRGTAALTGSWLGLDVGMVEVTIPRLATSGNAARRIFDESSARAISESVVFTSGRVFPTDATRVLDALAAGRSRVSDWRRSLPERAQLASLLRDAGVDEWRTNVIVWVATQRPARAFEVLTNAEVVWIGGGVLPELFGVSDAFAGGCLCRTDTRRWPLESLRGRSIGVAAVLGADIALRLGEHLAALKLPASLVPTLLPIAAGDWLDHVSQQWADDWEAFAYWPSRLPVERVEEYMLYLVSSGTVAAAGSVR